MNFKKAIAVIWIFFVYAQAIFSQESKIAGAYLKISGEGLLSAKLQESKDKKTVALSTLGGFLAIHSVDSNFIPELLYKTYFKASATAEVEKTNSILQHIDNQFYISIGQIFVVEVLDKKTNNLLKRYQVYRTKQIPKIQLERKKQHTAQSEKRTIIKQGDKLVISPNETIRFVAVGSENLSVSYVLTNLKTRKSVGSISDNGFTPERLAANTDYTLRFHYAVQPESEGTYYLTVNPYWYQSLTAYLISGVLIVLLLLVIVFWFFRNKIKSSEKRQQKIEQAALRLQSLLNPHFTFNALSTIQGLMNTDRVEEANYYLQEFSSLLRKTLVTSQQVFNSLDQEMEMMRMYIRLEALRFNFSWEIQISPEMDTTSIEIPTLLVQPLIENSIKHGLSGLGEKGKLVILCRIGNQEDTLEIVVKDNGSWKEKGTQPGYGLSLTEERITTINTLSKEQSISLGFNKYPAGTEAILTFCNFINSK